jgi:hypothetical protein
VGFPASLRGSRHVPLTWVRDFTLLPYGFHFMIIIISAECNCKIDDSMLRKTLWRAMEPPCVEPAMLRIHKLKRWGDAMGGARYVNVWRLPAGGWRVPVYTMHFNCCYSSEFLLAALLIAIANQKACDVLWWEDRTATFHITKLASNGLKPMT